MNKLGIKTIAELEAAANDGRIAELAGFGAKTAANLLQAIEQRRKHSGRFLLSDAKIWSDELLDHFQGHPDVSQISAGGSFRRGRETIGDLDILIATKAAPTDHRAFSLPPGHRSSPRPGRDEGQRALESWDPGRFASGCKPRVSVCALLFHGKQGTQRGAARTRSAKWLDPE